MLVIFGGLPATGKTAIARELARQIGAVHLRIDSIEQAIRAFGMARQAINDAGYRVAYAVAEDNLRIGRTVIADWVNPLQLTRDAWVRVAKSAQVSVIEIEVKCSDASEHRRRVEARPSDIPGLKLPTWEEVVSREYHPWDREHVVIDTAGQTVERNVKMLREATWRAIVQQRDFRITGYSADNRSRTTAIFPSALNQIPLYSNRDNNRPTPNRRGFIADQERPDTTSFRFVGVKGPPRHSFNWGPAGLEEVFRDFRRDNCGSDGLPQRT